jgi:hypothetical protein
MKIVKIKYKLVLREPGKDEKIVWTGTQKECEKKKLDLSFSYNSEWLVVEEYEQDTKEVKFTFSGVLSFLVVCGLTYLYWTKNGKKIYIID